MQPQFIYKTKTVYDTKTGELRKVTYKVANKKAIKVKPIQKKKKLRATFVRGGKCSPR